MADAPAPREMGWIGIVRCGLVQVALGAVVVLTTSTLNRVMVVELALPAMLPGALVGFHYAVQLSRPRWGYGSDMGGRRTPWILGGMAVLATGGLLAALATYLMGDALTLGLVLAFSMERLLAVSAGVTLAALALTGATLFRLERTTRALGDGRPASREPGGAKPAFRTVIAEIWAEGDARRFTLFVFASMLAYSMQDLILEPFAGHVFAMTPGQSTQLAGTQHGGVFVGMVLVGIACSGWARGRFGTLRDWTIGGCLASAAAIAALALGTFAGPGWALQANVFLLGLANGAFAVAAIGQMMNLAGAGKARREGVRMGLWGAAQAIAFGLGGFLGTVVVDAMRALFAADALAYAVAFSGEGLLFLISAALAARVRAPSARPVRHARATDTPSPAH